MGSKKAFKKHLVRASSEMARLALDSINASERGEVASASVRTGMAMEFLLRAVVASVSPALLFAPRNARATTPAAMVQALRAERIDVEWLSVQVSSEMSFVRGLAAEIVPALAEFSGDIESVVKRRDAVVHMYAVNASGLRSAVTSLARVAAVVLPHLKATAEQFWEEERVALVDALINERAEAVRADVALKIRDAELFVAQLRANLSGEDAAAIMALLESEGSDFYPPGPSQVFRATCPACEYEAELIVRVQDEIERIGDLELGGRDENAAPTAVLIPQVPTSVSLQCPVCRLRLSQVELSDSQPHLADPLDYEVGPRRAHIREYEEMLADFEPDWETHLGVR
ncbi:hypothetical protein [Microbacterium sp. LWH12-1.2]|uniref:hypothetical protein n=1 Tax=Microbacterium sp. LWH12-1.2 TaxID=3135259 RepID=UPI003443B002